LTNDLDGKIEIIEELEEEVEGLRDTCKEIEDNSVDAFEQLQDHFDA